MLMVMCERYLFHENDKRIETCLHSRTTISSFQPVHDKFLTVHFIIFFKKIFTHTILIKRWSSETRTESKPPFSIHIQQKIRPRPALYFSFMRPGGKHFHTLEAIDEEPSPEPDSRTADRKPPQASMKPPGTGRGGGSSLLFAKMHARQVVPLSGGQSSESGSTTCSLKTLLEGSDDPKQYTPISWDTCFDSMKDLHVNEGADSFRVYYGGTEEPQAVAVFLHGGGHSALSWALVAKKMKEFCGVLAIDARGHGNSKNQDEANLSASQLTSDVVTVISEFFGSKDKIPSFVLVGHSMGGSIAIKVAESKQLPSLQGIVVIDVVEGSALAALPHMQSFLASRPSTFPSQEKAIAYTVRSGQVRNLESARISVPPQIWKESTSSSNYVWRTDLQASDKYWREWFQGMSKSFLTAPVAKLLLLAGVDRLDTDLTIGQIQGKFQLNIMRDVGHSVHEDEPDKVAEVVLEFMKRYRLIRLPGASNLPLPFAFP